MQVYHQGTSQFKGVSWAERSKKWRAQLWFGNKVLPLLIVCEWSGADGACQRLLHAYLVQYDHTFSTASGVL